ncbi:MAG TPA: hypothetical protein VGB18_02550 [Candidatus Thermoplasmatota archaeon]
MTTRITVQFLPLGPLKVPTVDVAVQMRRGKGELAEAALLDTGSHLTVFSEERLRLSGFPVKEAHEDTGGVVGLGGSERLFYLSNATMAFEGQDGESHFLNLPRLYFTKVRMPPILGTEDLRRLNARIFLDFFDETGYIEIG